MFKAGIFAFIETIRAKRFLDSKIKNAKTFREWVDWVELRTIFLTDRDFAYDYLCELMDSNGI